MCLIITPKGMSSIILNWRGLLDCMVFIGFYLWGALTNINKLKPSFPFYSYVQYLNNTNLIVHQTRKNQPYILDINRVILINWTNIIIRGKKSQNNPQNKMKLYYLFLLTFIYSYLHLITLHNTIHQESILVYSY